MSAIHDLIGKLIAETRARHPDRPALIGVGGAQGSGKSYQSRTYAAAHAGVAHFSLDDVYLTKAEREARAKHFNNPLFATRGPPGTHDVALLLGVIARLGRSAATPIPRFNKAQDDRAPEHSWPQFEGPALATLVDGWCMGAMPPRDWQNFIDAPAAPINIVEAEDQSGVWRTSINAALQNYQSLFAAFDSIIYLQAPSWEIVRVWRGEQEEETLGRSLSAEENAALDRFVMHYERVTRDMLAGHLSAHWIVRLDAARNVIGIEER